jgi:hypothetical protein
LTINGKDHSSVARADQRPRSTTHRPGSVEDRIERISGRVVQGQQARQGGGPGLETIRWATERLVRGGERDPRDRRVLEVTNARERAMTPAALDAWAATCAGVAAIVAEDSFVLWFEPLELLGEHRGWLLIGGPSRILRWVDRRYRLVLNRCLEDAETEFAGVHLIHDDRATGALAG